MNIVTHHTRRTHLCFRVNFTSFNAPNVSPRILDPCTFESGSGRPRSPMLTEPCCASLEHPVDIRGGRGGQGLGGGESASPSPDVIAQVGVAAETETLGHLPAFSAKSVPITESLPDSASRRILDDNEIAVGLIGFTMEWGGARVVTAVEGPPQESQKGEVDEKTDH